MNTIFLFPGQGSQSVGMGKDLAEKYALARSRYDEANDILGFNIAKICFEGSEEDLKQTRVTQPALYVHSCIVTELLAERGLNLTASAGHSLGEYSSLAAAKVFSFADGLRLVKVRAESMQKAGEVNPGTMAAIVGMEDDAVAQLCTEASTDGIVVPANFNSPGQIVISGSVAAVKKAVEMAPAKGAKIAKELTVSGAFHSPLMGSAAEALNNALSTIKFEPPVIPVISNVTSQPHSENTEIIKELLGKQLTSPVRWTESMNTLSQLVDQKWFEVGSGNVLSGLLKRCVKGVSARTIGKAEDIEKLFNVAESVS